jgi:hypothetical protein
MNKWEAKFGFFWYNDDELFKFTQKDFDEKAKRIADAGINIVMTFSCTHFRWTFYRYWDRILRCIEMTVKACHKYGIKVVEHHSSHLTFNPQCQDDWDYMERILHARGSSIASWEGLAETVNDDICINGKPISSFRQIDGRTGKHAWSNYRGYCMCFNNPDYRQAYFQYLERVYQTGVDGIMTDDVQYFAQGHACACEYCRRLFKEETGYDLPEPGKAWESFWRDYDNPVYIAWERFRRKSTERFQRAVNRHFEDLGLHLLRPNYVSGALNSNPTAYCFDMGSDLWDWIFQENCFSTLIRVSWPYWYVESLHRYALARKHGVPSMSLFYPDREDSYYFVWALAQSWGQMLTVTPEGYDLSSIEKKYRTFEKKYDRIYSDQQKIAPVALLFSLNNAYYVKAQKHTEEIFGFGQGMYLSNIPVDMVFDDDPLEKLEEYAMIVLPNLVMLDELQITRLRKYAEQGGMLFITGLPGIKAQDGTTRPLEKVLALLGITSVPKKVTAEPSNFTVKYDGEESGTILGQQSEYIFEDAQNKGFLFAEKGVAGIWEKVGKGRIYWIPSGLSLDILRPLNADRFQRTEVRVQTPPNNADNIKKTMRLLMSPVKKALPVAFEKIAEDRVATVYLSSDKKKLIVHVVNTENVYPKKPVMIGHSDLVPSFVSDYRPKESEDTVLRLREDFKISKAVLISPENKEEIGIPVSVQEGSYVLSIPMESFYSYAAIVCDLE